MNSPVAEPRPAPCIDNAGDEMYRLIERLYPICRSITGDGVRETLCILQEYLRLTIHEVPTGAKVFDWTVPREWNIRDAYIDSLDGRRMVDFKQCNLHVVSYSMPIKKRVSLDELKQHVFTLPEQPDLVPYRTSYYHQTWGFCLSQNQLNSLTDDEYDVCIDSSLVDGSLTYGEFFLPGEVSEEVLVSTHVCHPSLCNDNLSGIALAVALARELASRTRHYSYRFLFIPGTIGSITWLSRNEDHVHRIKHGLVIGCVGNRGGVTYKKSRRGDAEIDRAVEHVLMHSADDCSVIAFSPYGYDERQYCSPGFDLPVGCLMRTPHGQFPEYHTSADNLDLVCRESLLDSLAKTTAALDILEGNDTYFNQNPKCEPHLAKHGLHRPIGGRSASDWQMALLWVLNLSDGGHSLLDIAQRSGLEFGLIRAAADDLTKAGLLKAESRAAASDK